MNGTTCYECEENYLNVAGTCVDLSTNPIANCKNYDIEESKVHTFPFCTECLDGFYLSEDNTYCKTIELENCAKWGEEPGRVMLDPEGN